MSTVINQSWVETKSLTTENPRELFFSCNVYTHPHGDEHRLPNDLSIPGCLRARPGSRYQRSLRPGCQPRNDRRSRTVSLPVPRNTRTQVWHVAGFGIVCRFHLAGRLITQFDHAWDCFDLWLGKQIDL